MAIRTGLWPICPVLHFFWPVCPVLYLVWPVFVLSCACSNLCLCCRRVRLSRRRACGNRRRRAGTASCVWAGAARTATRGRPAPATAVSPDAAPGSPGTAAGYRKDWRPRPPHDPDRRPCLHQWTVNRVHQSTAVTYGLWWPVTIPNQLPAVTSDLQWPVICCDQWSAVTCNVQFSLTGWTSHDLWDDRCPWLLHRPGQE